MCGVIINLKIMRPTLDEKEKPAIQLVIFHCCDLHGIESLADVHWRNKEMIQKYRDLIKLRDEIALSSPCDLNTCDFVNKIVASI